MTRHRWHASPFIPVHVARPLPMRGPTLGRRLWRSLVAFAVAWDTEVARLDEAEKENEG